MVSRVGVYEKLIHAYAQNTNGAYVFPTGDRPFVEWPGGQGTFFVSGTISASSNVALQVLGPDGVTWFNVGVDTTRTSSGAGNFALPPCLLRARVTIGSVGTTNVHASIGRVTL
jgi:hypothetical protein